MVSISSETKRKVLKVARDKAKELAIEAKESMANEYMTMISKFYFENVFDGGTTNEPLFYDRYFNYKFTNDGIMSSGLGHTFKKYYYVSPNKNTYGGGITISTAFMTHEKYNGTYDMVLTSFLRGWHELPGEQYGGIPSQYIIWDHMMKYKKKLRKELEAKFEIEIG